MNKIPCSSQNIWRPKPCLLMFASLVALSGFHLQLSTQLTTDLTPYFIHCHTFLLCWNSCKQCSELLTCCCFWSTVSKHGTHFEHSFFLDKCSCKMVNTLPSDIFNSSAISYNFNLQLVKMSLWSFLGQLPNLGDLSVQHHLYLCNYIWSRHTTS